MSGRRWRKNIKSDEFVGLPCTVCGKPIASAIYNEARMRWEFKHGDLERASVPRAEEYRLLGVRQFRAKPFVETTWCYTSEPDDAA